MAIRRIGVLTGGGDVPGVNACIKAHHGTALGWDAMGIRSGCHGLLDYFRNACVPKLTC
jgi:6-phosphofructokinase 1